MDIGRAKIFKQKLFTANKNSFFFSENIKLKLRLLICLEVKRRYSEKKTCNDCVKLPKSPCLDGSSNFN